jgi:hypothetical protein
VSAPDTVVIDGIERPTRNSEGRLIHDTLEGVANFWRWFGDSRVVDAEGRPLVVYHGTYADAITAFEPTWRCIERSAMPHELRGNGSIAQLFAMAKQEPELHWFAVERCTAETYGPVCIEAYLRIHHLIGNESVDNHCAVDILMEKDADGAMCADQTSWGRYGGVAYAVRSGAQIKSATGNSGRFDPASASLTDAEEARAPAPKVKPRGPSL